MEADMWELNIKAAHEALEEVGEAGKISDDAIENIVAWVMGNEENQDLLHAPIPNPLEAEIERLQARHSKELAAKEQEIGVYRNSVRKRHRAKQVWIEGDLVMYER